MNWKVGDSAICITPGSKIYGLEVRIVSELVRDRSYDVDGSICTDYTYALDGPPTDGLTWCAEPRYLIPIPDDFSRYHNELAEKGPCVWEWKPRELVQ